MAPSSSSALSRARTASAKKIRKKEKSRSKTDVNFYVCDKNKKSAGSKVELSLNWMEKFLGANISTAPIFLGNTSANNHHFAFSTKIKEDRAEEFIKYAQIVDLSSWNVIGVQVNNSVESLDLKNSTRHYKNCGYPGDGPI